MNLFILMFSALAATLYSSYTFPEIKPVSEHRVFEIDTLIQYDVSLTAISKNSRTKYYLNDRRCSRSVYLKYKKFADNLKDCIPCHLKTYDLKGRLLTEGLQYTDCPIGSWTEYHKNGQIKLKGQYRSFLDSVPAPSNCSVRDGQWNYYSSKGGLIKTENYKNGKLLE